MADTSAIGFTPKLKYPEQDVATSTADQVEKGKVQDGKGKTDDTWAGFQQQDTWINDLANAGKVVGTLGYGLGKALLVGDMVDGYGAIEQGGKALYNYATGEPEKVAQDVSWYVAKKLLKTIPTVAIVMKGIDGAGALVKTDKSAKDIAHAHAEGIRQVFHNERVQIDVQRYLLDQGMISKAQYEDSMKGMSPFADHYAYGNGSPIDDHAAAFAAKVKQTGGDALIAAQFKEGKVAAVRFGIRTKADVAAAKASSPAFAKAYEANAVFRAGVDAMTFEFARDKAKFDQDTAALALPAPPPVKG
jgi:hypothetical protein